MNWLNGSSGGRRAGSVSVRGRSTMPTADRAARGEALRGE